VDSVHVRRDHEPAQDAFHEWRNAHVAVIEHRRAFRRISNSNTLSAGGPRLTTTTNLTPSESKISMG
jgi:hypothetical protein